MRYVGQVQPALPEFEEYRGDNSLINVNSAVCTRPTNYSRTTQAPHPNHQPPQPEPVGRRLCDVRPQ